MATRKKPAKKAAKKPAAKKAPVGRPKKDLELLWSGWQGDILALYGEGASNEEIKAEIAIRSEGLAMSNDLWKRWMKDYPEFSETINRGKMLSAAWWQCQGRKNLQNKEFSPTLWYMNMKNRFGWADKTENKTEHSVKVPGLGWARK